MANIYQRYLDKNQITRYKIAKISGITAGTLQHVVQADNVTDMISGKVLRATGKALGKESWEVFRDILNMEAADKKAKQHAKEIEQLCK